MKSSHWVVRCLGWPRFCGAVNSFTSLRIGKAIFFIGPMLCRVSLWVLLLIGGVFGNVTVASAENSGGGKPPVLTEQQKKELFLKAREDLFPVSTPPATPQPQPSKSSTKKEEPQNPPVPPKASPKKEKRKKSRIVQASAPETKPAKKSPSSSPSKSQKAAAPLNTRKGLPNSSRDNRPYSEALETPEMPIRIVKSGHQEDMGWAPAATERKGLFGKRYRYLTSATRRVIDRTSVKRGRWKYIIIHNSGTRQGNARIFDIYHRRVRRMQNGLAYHFVIGNGHSSGNGQIEVGNRWLRQINGGHVASDYLNNIALGICLVGDYNRDFPTPQQLSALEELISYLRLRVGRYKGRYAIVMGHREINPKPTDCPGKKFPMHWLHRKFPNR